MFWCHDCVQSHIWMMMDGMGLGWNPVLFWGEFGWVQRASFSWSSWAIHWAPLQRGQWAASAWQNQSMPPLQEEMGSSIWEIVKSKFMPSPGSNRGPLDLQSNALPTELSRHLISYRLVATLLLKQYYYNKHEWIWLIPCQFEFPAHFCHLSADAKSAVNSNWHGISRIHSCLL